MNQANKYFVRGECFRGVVLAFTAADALLQWEIAHEEHTVSQIWPCTADEPTCEQLDQLGGWIELNADGTWS